jgi:hypothetical protein
MKRLFFLLIGLLVSLSINFIGALTFATPATVVIPYYATLKYAKETVLVNVLPPSVIVAGRNNFEFQFVDTKNTPINTIVIKDVSGTSKMTSMQMGEDKILFKKGSTTNSLIGSIRFAMSSMEANDFLVTLLYKGEAQSFTVTVK